MGIWRTWRSFTIGSWLDSSLLVVPNTSRITNPLYIFKKIIDYICVIEWTENKFVFYVYMVKVYILEILNFFLFVEV